MYEPITVRAVEPSRTDMSPQWISPRRAQLIVKDHLPPWDVALGESGNGSASTGEVHEKRSSLITLKDERRWEQRRVLWSGVRCSGQRVHWPEEHLQPRPETELTVMLQKAGQSESFLDRGVSSLGVSAQTLDNRSFNNGLQDYNIISLLINKEKNPTPEYNPHVLIST